MSRVIKADYARLIPPGESKKRIIAPTKRDAPAETDEENAVFPVMSEEEKANEVQAAYEDLLATAQNEVAMMMEDARRTARQIAEDALQEAEAQIEADRRRAVDQGYAEGHAAGVEAAGNECRSILAGGQEEVNRVLREAYQERDRILAEAEPRIFTLTLDIAHKILGYELENNQEAFMSMVREGVSSLSGETHVTLHVHSADFLQAFHSQETISIPTPNGRVTANVNIDPAAVPGGCVIETESGTVDISVEAQLEQIAMHLGVEQE